MMAAMGHEHKAGKGRPASKRHCRLLHHALKEPLWAGSDDDWEVVLKNRASVICDKPGCRQPLIVRNPVKRARHFAYPRNAETVCDHNNNLGPEDANTAEISDRHLWMQEQLTTICRQLGHSATAEHWPTRADVYVNTTKTALEVQQRRTEFAERTATRIKHGASQTIWMLSHDARDPQCDNALFTLPAVRFKVVDARRTDNTRTIEFEPWTDPAALNEYATIDIFATTWQLTDTAPYLERRRMDLRTFLDEVLSGRRLWHKKHRLTPPNKKGYPQGGWILTEDLNEVNTRKNRDAKAAAERARISAAQQNPPEQTEPPPDPEPYVDPPPQPPPDPEPANATPAAAPPATPAPAPVRPRPATPPQAAADPKPAPKPLPAPPQRPATQQVPQGARPTPPAPKRPPPLLSDWTLEQVLSAAAVFIGIAFVIVVLIAAVVSAAWAITH